MRNAGTPTPIRIGWGDYLLIEASRRGFATPRITGGPAPEGYWLKAIHPGPTSSQMEADEAISHWTTR